MISNKTILITGASSGIGRALVHELAKERNFLIVSGRSEAKLLALAEEVSAPMLLLPMDVADEAQMLAAEKRLKVQVDSLDLVIMCAGTCEYQDGWQVNPSLHRRVFDTNYFGAVNTVRMALPLLKNSQSAPRLVGVGSLSSLVPFPRAEAYGASKAALDYFLESLRVDVAPIKVAVTMVRPGFVDTPLTRSNDFDMPFLMAPEVAAKTILRGIAKGKNTIHFPLKLSLTLGFFRVFHGFWSRIVAPKLRKQDTF
ncbi:SDR family oxidoreductase [Marinimicrobium sp. ABcell2]|uniref:SDR family NAD(P)-dependent oxidoreductase n=1 Tax=Marinimicrobium sp. ABcell2 TaxID=3069751 RepID=UPI0027AEEDBE|nr:SDR family NAD(P)-dependent oxidoreductase [Marinimicrobium sp. ABcell2]MDQ2076801.1 SDR family NAD(P)-dependent oxidoreductase [Marinimicrobium sp. ABcell2]